VTNITGVPSLTKAGTPLNLSGTVSPANATNKDIVWNVKSAGETGATISGNSLYVTDAGTVVVTATITNGKAEGSPYTQDFTIMVRAEDNTVTLKVAFQTRPPLDEANIENLDVRWIKNNVVIARESVTTNKNGEVTITLPPDDSTQILR